LFLFGIFLLLNSKINIAGAAVGISSIPVNLISTLGIIIVLTSIIFFILGENLEAKIAEIQDIANSKHWIKYHITADSVPIDRKIGYLRDSSKFSSKKITPLQERIEKMTNQGKIISHYVGSDNRNIKNANKEAVNRRATYAEQFHEPHAAAGGRIIEVVSHISNGKLMHFNKSANGEYIWIIDERGNFVVGNRINMTHDMFQMPADFGSGTKHAKIDKRKTTLPHPTLAKGLDVYGAGEVIVKNGLISSYNADSGHYVKLMPDVNGPSEPDNYVKQSIEAFDFFSKKAGWKKVKGGAKYNSHHS